MTDWREAAANPYDNVTPRAWGPMPRSDLSDRGLIMVLRNGTVGHWIDWSGSADSQWRATVDTVGHVVVGRLDLYVLDHRQKPARTVRPLLPFGRTARALRELRAEIAKAAP